MNSNMHLSSPTKTYVLFVENRLGLTEDLIFKVTLPYPYNNNVEAAQNYFHNTINAFAKISGCLPYEKYAEQTLAEGFVNRFTPHHDFQPTSSDTVKLVADIKMSLATFYGMKPDDIADSELIEILEKLESDSLRYLGIVTTINRAIKDGIKR